MWLCIIEDFQIIYYQQIRYKYIITRYEHPKLI